MKYEQEKELIELKHTFAMEELKYIRETEKLRHESQLEQQRIKSAEIRKNLMRKAEPSKVFSFD